MSETIFLVIYIIGVPITFVVHSYIFYNDGDNSASKYEPLGFVIISFVWPLWVPIIFSFLGIMFIGTVVNTIATKLAEYVVRMRK